MNINYFPGLRKLLLVYIKFFFVAETLRLIKIDERKRMNNSNFNIRCLYVF